VDKSYSFPGVARTNAVAFVIDGKAYVGTGYDDNANVLSDFWKYDQQMGWWTWTRVADFGVSNTTIALPRYGAFAFSVKNRGFVGGGEDKSLTGYKDFGNISPADDLWIKRTSWDGHKRWNAFVMVIDDFAYMGGGQDNGIWPTDFWKFDVTKIDGTPGLN